MSRPPTPQQEAIFEAVTSADAHLLCEAVAGAGKTTTSVKAASMAAAKDRGLRVGFCSFNKHIAVELQGRLGASASASTLHALGHAAVLNQHPAARLVENKAELVAARLWPGRTWEGRDKQRRPDDQAKAVVELARKCKVTWSDPAGKDGPRVAETICNFYGLDTGGMSWKELAGDAAELLAACSQDLTTIDFDDMVWLPVKKGWPVGDFDLLFVDECQDLGRTQSLLARAAAPSGRLVCVGDRRQAINAFAGADPESVERLEEELGAHPRGLQARPLTVTFRCPASHVRLAQRIVPHIEPAPWAEEGEIRRTGAREAMRATAPGDLVLCRTNAPLVQEAFRLIREGRPALVRGREIGKGLVALVNRLKAGSVEDLVKKLRRWAEREAGRLEDRGASAQAVQAVEDRAECLGQLASACDSIDELRETLGRVFGDDERTEGRVVLSSVHRAKGLEADRVVILCPDKLPLSRRDQQAWELKAELNVLYVAVTRAKKELVFAGDLPAPLR